MQAQFVLQPLTISNIQEVIKFTQTTYVIKEPICIHMSTQPQQFSEQFHNLFAKCLESGYSFCYREKGKIVSLITTVDLKTYSEPVSIPANPHFDAIQAIIYKNWPNYLPICAEKTLCIFIGCTHQNFEGKGLFTSLIKQLVKLAKQKQITQITADCTNLGSQKAVLKCGFEVFSKVSYDEFEFEGKYPFKGIKGTQHLSLMVKKL